MTTLVGMLAGAAAHDQSHRSRPLGSAPGAPLRVGLATAVFIVQADGTGLKKLVVPSPSSINEGATWAPDGIHVAFFESDINEPAALRVVRTDGSDMRTMAAIGSDPNWKD